MTSAALTITALASSAPTSWSFTNGKPLRLQPHDRAVAGEAWTLFVRKDGDGILRLLEREPFERLPKMKKALLRCIEEIPDREGLTRTQRQILQLVAGGRHEFAEIFEGLAEFEEYPFLCDTACQRLLARMVREGFLIHRGSGYGLPRTDPQRKTGDHETRSTKPQDLRKM